MGDDLPLPLRRALRLAVRSLGWTAPNPGVACVVERDGQILGEGRHERCGEAHAEVNALADCRRRGHDPRGATAWVTLAPCTRHGRTPPCCDALIAAGVARVVAAMTDGNQDDAGERLRSAGIRYEIGLGANVAQHLHGGFAQRIAKGRPRITGKWAMTLDGFIAAHSGHSAWISSPTALALSRRRRRAFDAIVVGAGTAAADDPGLLAQDRDGRSPRRVVISATARLALSSQLACGARDRAVLIIHDHRAAEAQLAALRACGVHTIAVADAHDPQAWIAALAGLGCNEVLVEGGAALHHACLTAGLYDRLEVYLSARSLGGGRAVAGAIGAARIDLGQGWLPEQPALDLGGTLCWRLRRA